MKRWARWLSGAAVVLLTGFSTDPVRADESPCIELASSAEVLDDQRAAENEPVVENLVDPLEPDDIEQGDEPASEQPAHFASHNESNESRSAHRHHHHCHCRQGKKHERWKVSFSQSADYVTNLALPFALTPNNASVLLNDAQFQTLGALQYRVWTDGKATLTTAYTFYQSLHPVVHQLDLSSHTSLTNYTRVFNEKVRASAEYEFSYFFLEGQSFVSRNRVGTKWLYSPNKRYDWQVGYDLSHNQFWINPSLTSIANSARVESIRYLRKRDNFLTFGFAYGRNDAELNSWSYNVYNSFASGRWKFGPQNKNELIVLGSYGIYDFQDYDVIQTTTIRHDHIYTVSMKLGRTVNDHMALFALYQYYNAVSNLVRQNYDSSLVSVGAQVAW